MAQKVRTKSAEPSLVEKLEIISNKDGRTVNITGGLVELNYYESILNDTIRVEVTFVDSGFTVEGEGSTKKTSVIEGLPLCGQERVNLKFKDNNNNSLGDKPKLTLYVNKITPQSENTRASIVTLELVSREYILNEKIRVNERFDGKLSDHVRTILTGQSYLATEKNVEIEDTINNFNFFGNNKKPYYTINWLSKKGVSAQSQELKKSAGYFFYETSDGFFFKSIDGLLEQKPKVSMIYNETPDFRGNNIPEGYDFKVLDYSKDNLVNVNDKLKIGAFSTRTVLFDPFTCLYQVLNPNAIENEESLKLGGKNLFLGQTYRNKEFDIPGRNKEFSRTTYYLLDKGTIPTGNTQQQVEKSKTENFEYSDILNQSIMRYNQLFSAKYKITIAGNFSLHAGDAVFLDVPQLEEDKTKNVSKGNGGLYIITDMCHRITPSGTFTYCNLIRDSFGRKGNHTNRSQ
jgi:hypothetical protein